MNEPEIILKKFWGFDSFKGSQREIIEDVLNKKDVFALLPTGAGKSLCYQLPTMMFEGLCLVISPLIALMEDQVQSLMNKGIKGLVLSSRLSQSEMITAFDNLAFGPYKFIYISPEKLQSNWIQEKISRLNIALIAIDEAHCISQWGHDFRPSYQNIREMTQFASEVPMIALTATATPKVQKDIIANLALKEVCFYKDSFYRPNLQIDVSKRENLYQELKHRLKSSEEPAIVYTGTRKESIRISEYLNQHGIHSRYYHGGLTYEEKSAGLRSWTREEFRVMVATNAFGMGIDKANVRTLIHLNIPFSPENYIQEIGRAGRDGKLSTVLLLYNDQSLAEAREFLKKSMVSVEDCKMIYTRLHEYFQIARGELPTESYQFDLQDFCSTYELSALKVFTTLNQFQQEGIIDFNQNLHRLSRIRITDHRNRLMSFQDQKSQRAQVIQLLLRNYAGIHEQAVSVNERFLAGKLNLSKGQVISILENLRNDQVIHYHKSSKNILITFLTPREERFVLNKISRNIRGRNQVKIKNLDAVIRFVKNQDHCRFQQLLAHFGEPSPPCGHCDVCSDQNGKTILPISEIQSKVLRILHENEALSMHELSDLLETDPDRLLKSLELLIEKKQIKLNLQNQIELA